MKALPFTGAFSKQAAALAVLLLASACTTPGVNREMAEASGTSLEGNDGARVERLLKYCSRLNDNQDYYLASGMCARAHELDPTNPLPLMMMADAFIGLERPQDAVVAYETLLASDPVHPEALYRLGKAHMDLGQNAQALTALQSAVHVNPNDARVHNALAILHDQRGEHMTAQMHYRNALKLDPSNISIASNYGLSLVLSGQKYQAIEVLSKVVEDPRATSISHHNLAMAYAAPDPVPEIDIAADSTVGASVHADVHPEAPMDEPQAMMEPDSGDDGDIEGPSDAAPAAETHPGMREPDVGPQIIPASFDPNPDGVMVRNDQPLVLPPYRSDESITAVSAPLTLTYRASGFDQASAAGAVPVEVLELIADAAAAEVETGTDGAHHGRSNPR